MRLVMATASTARGNAVKRFAQQAVARRLLG